MADRLLRQLERTWRSDTGCMESQRAYLRELDRQQGYFPVIAWKPTVSRVFREVIDRWIGQTIDFGALREVVLFTVQSQHEGSFPSPAAEVEWTPEEGDVESHILRGRLRISPNWAPEILEALEIYREPVQSDCMEQE